MTFDRTVLLLYYFPQMYLHYKKIIESFCKHTNTFLGGLFGTLLPSYTNLGKNDNLKILTLHMLE